MKFYLCAIIMNSIIIDFITFFVNTEFDSITHKNQLNEINHPLRKKLFELDSSFNFDENIDEIWKLSENIL